MDLLNLSGDERLDLGDLTFALSRVPTGLTNELTGSFCVAPGETAIVTGFRPAASGTTAVVVGEANVPNVAFLGQRIGSTVTQGVLTMQGPSTQTVSTATLPAATYTVFIRFNRIPGVSQTRKFWAKALPGSEYSQLTDTRQVATWEVRLETSAPSAEWVPIATAVVTAAGTGQGNTVVVTDTRLLYFEGRVDQGCVPVWGTAADRTSDRTLGNTGSLRRQLDAIRSCLVDLKGRGLAKWWQPNISGMLVGSAFTLTDLPTANQLAIGDTRFFLGTQNSDSSPTIAFDGAADYLIHSRSGGSLRRFRGGTVTFNLQGNGSATFGQGLSNGYLSAFQPANANQYGISTVTSDANTRATIGIQSLAATSAFLELGSRGYGQGYGLISSNWAAAPRLSFAVDNATFITATATTGDPAVAVKSSAFAVNCGVGTADFNAATINLNSRRLIPQAVLFASGYYNPGANGSAGTVSPFYASNGGQSISVSLDGNSGIVLSFSQGIPSGAIVTATAVVGSNGRVPAVATMTDTSAARFYCQYVDSPEKITSIAFYFSISYGA